MTFDAPCSFSGIKKFRDLEGVKKKMITTQGPEGLRSIEELLHEVGVEAAVVAPQSKIVNKRPALNPQSKDCLSSENKTLFHSSSHLETRRSPSPSSMIRGLPFPSKDVSAKRFYGSQFCLPVCDSPGPIYEYHSLLDDHGVSFTKAPKMRSEMGSVCSGVESEETLTIPGSVGKQVLSSWSSATSAVFPTSSRFSSKLSDSPAPNAYQASNTSTNDGHGAVLQGSRVNSSKIFISRAHVADCIGADSPGPMYHPNDGVPKMARNGVPGVFSMPGRSSFAAGPAFKLGSSRHSDSPKDIPADITDPTRQCNVTPGVNDSGKSGSKPTGTRHCINTARASSTIPMRQEPFISHEHSKVQSTANTPGPAFYTPDYTAAKVSGPAVSFTKAKRTQRDRKAINIGPIYDPNFDSIRKKPGSIAFGALVPEDAMPNRFPENVYLGKGIGEVPGRDTPGPVYDPDHAALPAGPSYTIVFKERQFPRKVFPGPSRPRFISHENAKDNLGSYGPGPKYDIRTNFGADALGYGFSQAPRLAGPKVTSIEAEEAAAEEKEKSKKKGKPVLLNPKDETSSMNRRAPSTRIVSPSNAAKRRPQSSDGKPPLARDIVYTVAERQGPSVSFTTADRLPVSKAGVQPGPAHYAPNFKHVEQNYGTSVLGPL